MLGQTRYSGLSYCKTWSTTDLWVLRKVGIVLEGRKKERIILIRNGPTVNLSILLAGFKKNICSS